MKFLTEKVETWFVTLYIGTKVRKVYTPHLSKSTFMLKLLKINLPKEKTNFKKLS